jgi:AcrR family transcriptional regulator
LPRRPPRPYHHGDLARALRTAALALIDELGPDGFALREVARRVGVSHAAPYRHYPDKRALFTALAIEGTNLLSESLLAALSAAGSDPRARFLAAAHAYVRFAVDHRAHFKVMFFASEVDRDSPEHRAASDRCWGILLAYIAECQSSGFLAPGDPLEISSAVWAMHHGLASLASVSALTKFGSLRTVSDAAHTHLLDGLIARPTPTKSPTSPPPNKTASPPPNKTTAKKTAAKRSATKL